MAKFTLLELHLDGATVNAPFSKGGGESDDEGSIEVSEEAPSGRAGAWKRALVGLLFLAVVAAAAKKKLGTDDEAELDA